MVQAGRGLQPTEEMRQAAARERLKKFKSDVRREVERRGLTSCMNNTRWALLIYWVMEELPFDPGYQFKSVLQERPDPAKLEPATAYRDPRPAYQHMWTFERWPYFAVEWFRVSPLLHIHRGLLVPPIVTDFRSQFLEILKRERIPFADEGEAIRIFGYIDPAGPQPDA